MLWRRTSGLTPPATTDCVVLPGYGNFELLVLPDTACFAINGTATTIKL
jgi:hypothetical protein